MVQIFGVLFAAGGTFIGAYIGYSGMSPLLFMKDALRSIKNTKTNKNISNKASDVAVIIVMSSTFFGGFCAISDTKIKPVYASLQLQTTTVVLPGLLQLQHMSTSKSSS